MEFEWDEAKAAANLLKHGLDSRIAASMMEGMRVLLRAREVGGKRVNWRSAGSVACL